MLRLSLAFALVLIPILLPAFDVQTTVPRTRSQTESLRSKDQKFSTLCSLIEKKKWKELGDQVRKEAEHQKITLKDLLRLSHRSSSKSFASAVIGTKKLLHIREKTGLTLSIAFPIALFAKTNLQDQVYQGKRFWNKTEFGRELQYDKETHTLYIHLGTRGVRPIGIGRKKVVTKTIAYDQDHPEVMARAVTSFNCENEMKAMKKLRGIPHLLQARSFMKHKDPKTHKILTTFATKIINPGSLQAVLDSDSYHLMMKERMKIACDLAQGLAGMHRKGFVHRDLGLRNYFIDIEGKKPGCRKICGYVADFGRTIPIHEAVDVPVQGNSSYLAPEAIYRSKMRKEDYYKSDIFALGCAFWKLYFDELPPWTKATAFKNKSISKKQRYRARTYQINLIRSHYMDLCKKNMEKGHPKKPSNEFLQLILKMTDPCPRQRGDAQSIFMQLHMLVYGKPPMPNGISDGPHAPTSSHGSSQHDCKDTKKK